MGTLIALLIFVLIVVVAIWIVDMLVGTLGLPANAVKIIKAILLLIAFLWLCQEFFHPLGGFYFR